MKQEFEIINGEMYCALCGAEFFEKEKGVHQCEECEQIIYITKIEVEPDESIKELTELAYVPDWIRKELGE